MRPDLDTYFTNIALAVAERSNCCKRKVGAILVKDKRIISTGYNGAPPGVDDCLQRGYCSKEEDLPCMAEGLHGESNAIIAAAKAGISVKDSVIYCTYSPCRSCANMIKTAGIVAVYYGEVYANYLEGPKYLEWLGISCEVCITGSQNG